MKTPTLFFLLLITFSIYSFAQAQEFRTGCILDAEQYEKVPLATKFLRGDYEALPNRFSLRKYAPTPQNQGSYGTCVGWATAYAAGTIMLAQQKDWDKEGSTNKEALINSFALSPFFVYEKAKSISDVYCQEGTSLFSALEIIKEIGAVKRNNFQDECGRIMPKNTEKIEFKISDYKRLFESAEIEKVKIIKKSIKEGKPVVIGIQCCTESFLNAKGKKFWQLAKTDKENPEGGHALTVIGYDDTYENESGKKVGAVELMNSWGTAWGDEGFIWMSYEDFNKYCFEAYEMSSKNTEAAHLSGKLQFSLSSGEKMNAIFKNGFYEMKEPYNSGTTFRFQVSNNEPAYIYAFSTDLTGQIYKIFPHSNQISAHLSYKNSNIIIPDEDNTITMDNTLGKDFFCVLYSSEKLNIDEIIQQLEQTPAGNIQQKIQKILGDKILPTNEINFSPKEIKFDGKSKDKFIIPVIVAIEHI